MKLRIEPAVLARFPGYRRYAVLVEKVDNRGPDQDLADQMADACARIRAEVEDIESDPRIEAWRAAYRSFGADPSESKPSVESLMARALGGQEIPFINKIVAASNLVSLRYGLPSGGDDLTELDGDFGIRLATGMEVFTPVGSSDNEPPEPGEVIYADESKVLCRKWTWRQSEVSKITEDCRYALINVDVLPPATPEDGLAAARELADLITRHCGGRVEILAVDADRPTRPIEPATAAAVRRERLEDDSIRRLVDAEGARLSESGDPADWSVWDLLRRGNVERIIVEKELAPKLERGDPIKIYQGFDPTSPNLHVGHLVSLRVLRWFQLQGHQVVFLIGDATALIGDPSGRSEQRAMLTADEIAGNMRLYQEQAALLLDFEGDNAVELLRNSEWLLPLTLEDVIRLTSEITVQRLLERDMFKARLANEEALYCVETIYPLLQGYDSVAMEVDAELGGRDQLFNMLVGRDLARSYLGKEKHVLTTPLLAGFDGRKMSKTYGNTVNLMASSFRLFDGIMQVNDELVMSYARLLTDLPWRELARLEGSIARDPLAVKEEVALEVVRGLKGEAAATAAHAEFIEVRRKGREPEQMPSVELPASPSERTLVDHLGDAQPQVVSSKSELRRLIRQKGVRLDDELVKDGKALLSVEDLDGRVLRIGKKRFFRLEVDPR